MRMRRGLQAKRIAGSFFAFNLEFAHFSSSNSKHGGSCFSAVPCPVSYGRVFA
jgi:hypothetical protein